VKFELDENLPDRLVAVLARLGYDVDTVYAERLNGGIDADVWNRTQTAHRFFITQDLDFSDMRRYAPGTHAGLLLVRLARPGRNALFERVSQVFETENVEDWAGCLVVATDRKVRVRRPAEPTTR
jgi:predicted nuclease of predicted toxin-antitoxin system